MLIKKLINSKKILICLLIGTIMLNEISVQAEVLNKAEGGNGNMIVNLLLAAGLMVLGAYVYYRKKK